MFPADYCLYVNRRRDPRRIIACIYKPAAFFLSAPPDIFTYAALLKNPSSF